MQEKRTFKIKCINSTLTNCVIVNTLHQSLTPYTCNYNMYNKLGNSIMPRPRVNLIYNLSACLRLHHVY